MEYWLEVVSSLVKVLSLLFPPIATALGLLVEYKTPEKRLTPWGRRAIGLTILTAFVSASSYYLDQRKSRISAEAALKDARKAITILNETADAAKAAAQLSSYAASKSADAANTSGLAAGRVTELGKQQEMTLSSVFSSVEDIAYGLVEFDLPTSATPSAPNQDVYWNKELLAPFYQIYRFIDWDEKFPLRVMADLDLGSGSQGMVRAQNRRNLNLSLRPDNETAPPP